MRVYEVNPGDEARVILPGAPLVARATPQGTIVDLIRERRIDRLVFSLEHDPWITAPRLAHSLDGEAWTEIDASASLADATLSLYRRPRQGYGEIRFSAVFARFLRVDALLPVRNESFYEPRL
jgi:hypothetical protein